MYQYALEVLFFQRTNQVQTVTVEISESVLIKMRLKNCISSVMFCGIVSEGPTDCGRSAGTYVTVADPQVRWFVLGNPDERPDYDCGVVSSKWITILCATVALVKAML